MSDILRRIIHINLTKKTISVQKLEEDLFKNYLGGSGLAAKLLYDELQTDLSPLHPDSPLLFFSGSPLPANFRFVLNLP